MSGRSQFKAVQGVSHSCHNLYEELQDKIWRKEGVRCSVLVKPAVISIRTESYADFVLAKKCIKGGCSLPIKRDE